MGSPSPQRKLGSAYPVPLVTHSAARWRPGCNPRAFRARCTGQRLAIADYQSAENPMLSSTEAEATKRDTRRNRVIAFRSLARIGL